MVCVNVAPPRSSCFAAEWSNKQTCPCPRLQAGSAGTGMLIRRFSPQQYMSVVYAVSALALGVPLFFHMELREPNFGERRGAGR